MDTLAAHIANNQIEIEKEEDMPFMPCNVRRGQPGCPIPNLNASADRKPTGVR